MRIAATADLHVQQGETGWISELLEKAGREADTLVICGDLTHNGSSNEAEAVAQTLEGSPIPVIATLGNHDHEGGVVHEVSRRLSEAGVRVLDRSMTEIGGVGFCGVKGFCGGYSPYPVEAFGEPLLKAFVAESIADATALRNELINLPTSYRVALLHYSPVRGTLAGEPPELYPFLGTGRLGEALDEGGATVAFHGHAHHGSFRGETPGGVLVYNVSVPVMGEPYHLLEVG